MSLKNATLGVLWIAILLSPQAWADVNLADGLAAHYRFDGNSADGSGNANHGTNAGGVTYGIDRFSVAGRCLQLDGTGKVTLGSVLASNPLDLTQSVWVLSPTVHDGKAWTPPIMTRRHVDADDWIGFGIDPRIPATTLNWSFDRAGWKPALLLSRQLLSNEVIDLTKWNHIVLVKKGSTVRVYLNGVSHHESQHTQSFAGSSSPFVIGYHGAWNRYFTGKIDDVRIYSRALSPEEVAVLHTEESFTAPRVATAQSSLTAGYLTGISITDPGSGYTTVPTVRVVGGGGTGATVVALVEAGRVVSLVITSAGSGYTETPRIVIESPPFIPTIAISVSKVLVKQKVRLNHNYVLESSSDLTLWTPVGPVFTALQETISDEFDVSDGKRYFRLREVP